MEKAEFKCEFHGPVAEHNYLCAVCRQRPAVLETWRGWLQPCWECQRAGMKLVKLGWILRFLGVGQQ